MWVNFDMNDEDTIMIRIEYYLKGFPTLAYGEISEIKLKQFLLGKENFIGITNNKELIWILRDSILKIEQLQKEEIRFERKNITIKCKENPIRCLEF